MIALWLLLFSAGAVAAVCAAVGFYMAYRLYHPYTRARRKPDLGDLDATPLRIPVGPGIDLDALLLRAGSGRHLVLITHELGAFKETKLRIARRLVQGGHPVLLFDLRNHGESSADRALGPMSEKFTDDVAAVLHYARERLPEMEKISLCSFSFSTFPSLYLVTRDLPPPDAMILDSGPSLAIPELYGRFLDGLGRPLVPRLLRGPVTYPLLKLCFRFFGAHMLATRWPPDLTGVSSRVLFVINGADPIFRPADVQALAGRVARHQVWVCPGSSHLQAHRTDPKGYEAALLDFLAGGEGAP